MTVEATVASTGEAFACHPGQTLLMAGLRAGLNLPYECASGACGSCRCKLIDGEVETLWADAPGLSDRDRRRGGTILMCQSRPMTDVRIDVRVREPIGIPRPLSTVATVVSTRPLTPDMMHITLAPADRMAFLPGQFVIVKLDGVGQRAYSMANVDQGGRQLELIVKVKPGGAVSGAFAHRHLVGDRVSVEGPYGGAYYRRDCERPVVGIAGGSGLAPIWSIAQAAAAGYRRDVHLYFGVNGPRDVCFLDEMQRLSTGNSRVKTHLIVRDDAPARTRPGLVGDAVIEDLSDLTGADVYMAGPPPMIDAILGRLVTESRIDSDRVFFDRFC
ncbi:2Fe-2S iron-sulfur cluster binding domain-containing protein [Sphingopyxis sp. OPL5]|uniref:2Fe-2S iron-sulfur cluster-binding protein n=1 Tax=Sphingopyxis sp. OPL5 TaxID=2486273 RepID=UPI0016572803|nr:2Fe-2S iron-sulfur cluster binding domain-containing protein [Sphingopyxis sp. OPL5]QNO27223.1 2Fe-2S iron-sulfur cluster binding domain-containing protein [Sphingopyxis sp. OPL5]